jgi:hypothetical protein
MSDESHVDRSGILRHELTSFEAAVEDFQDSSQEWRRLFSELGPSSSCSSPPAAA